MSDHSKVRLWMFWLLSVGTTALFLLLMATMLMVPGILFGEKLWMLLSPGLGAAASLLVGLWRPGTTDAPVADRPSATTMAVLLLLEAAYYAMSLFALITAKHH